MKNLKYSKILEMNKHLNSVLSAEQYQIGILANITINQIKEILEYSLRIEEINAKIKIGNYDNIVQDSLEFQNCNLIIIFWELSNIVGGLHHCIEIYETGELEEIFNKICTEINMVLRNLEKTSLVFLNQFTSLHFSSLNIKTSKLESLSERLNYFLKSITEKTNNIKLIDIDKVISYIGVEKSTDLRFYYSSKALYTIDFFKAYSQFVKPAIMSANGKSKKILVFDCDNTLWGGILGEDGINGIEMSQDTATGAIYREVQNIALDLSKNGILIGICSKNNPEDVDKVISREKIKNKVIFTGGVDYKQVRDLLRISDLFVNSSDPEGMGMAVYEASSSGLPLCLSNIGSFTSVFHDLALYNEPRDKKKLAENYLKLYKNPKLKRELGKKLQNYVKAWDYSFTIKRFDKELKEILKY